MKSRFLILAIVSIFTWLAGAATAQQLHLVDRILDDQRLVSLSTTGWTFLPAAPGSVNERPTTPGTGQGLEVDLASIVRWGAWPGILQQQAVWLSDGSWITGEITIRDGRRISVDNDWLQVVDLDLDSVRGLVLTPPASLSRWSELQSQMFAAQGNQDIVWLRDKQRVSGVLRLPANPDADGIILENGTLQSSIDLDDVRAIVFSPTLLGKIPPSSSYSVGLSDGSWLQVSAVLVEPEGVSLRLAGGIDLRSYDRPTDFTSAIVYLTGTARDTSFLSDSEPASYRSLSDNRLEWSLGVNRNVYGRALQSDHGLLNRGLSMHSTSQVAYRWDGTPARFLAEVELAPPVAGASQDLGSVACQVLLGRDGELQEVASFKLNRTDPDLDHYLVNVDIRDARLLVLVVGEDDAGQYGDQVQWLDARIVKSPQ